MKIKTRIIGFSIIFILVSLGYSCQNPDDNNAENKKSESIISDAEIIAKGEYLVGIMGCNDCHSPKRFGEMGPEVIPELLLSGYPADRPIEDMNSELVAKGFSVFYPDLTAARGPWGLTFAANLTPDATGIGSWTEEQFKIALTQGKYKGLENARMLLPPMPWVNYKDMTDEDIHAIFSYLKSINPVENIVPQPIAPNFEKE